MIVAFACENEYFVTVDFFDVGLSLGAAFDSSWSHHVMVLAYGLRDGKLRAERACLFAFGASPIVHHRWRDRVAFPGQVTRLSVSK